LLQIKDDIGLELDSHSGRIKYDGNDNTIWK